jgi:DNA-binding transcriptional regulator YiaG
LLSPPCGANPATAINQAVSNGNVISISGVTGTIANLAFTDANGGALDGDASGLTTNDGEAIFLFTDTVNDNIGRHRLKLRVSQEIEMKKPYHYTECGLDYVYLVDGFKVIETAHGPAVQVSNASKLDRTIALAVVRHQSRLTGQEVRFLRGLLDMTQEELGRTLGKDDQTVARWEKGKSKWHVPARLPCARHLPNAFCQLGPVRRYTYTCAHDI